MRLLLPISIIFTMACRSEEEKPENTLPSIDFVSIKCVPLLLCVEYLDTLTTHTPINFDILWYSTSQHLFIQR